MALALMDHPPIAVLDALLAAYGPLLRIRDEGRTKLEQVLKRIASPYE